VYAVIDASGSTNAAAHDAAVRRIEQAGGISMTALQVLLELQRDWAREDHYEEVMTVLEEHCHGCVPQWVTKPPQPRKEATLRK
jgi:hypothetical protein